MDFKQFDLLPLNMPLQVTWDLNRIPYKLGNALLFYAQIKLLAKKLNSSSVIINVIFSEIQAKEAKRRINVLNAHEYFERIVNLFSPLKSFAEVNFNQQKIIADAIQFPPVDFDHKSYLFLNYLNLSQNLAEIFPEIVPSEHFQSLKNKVMNKYLVFHLKNTPDYKIESNAKLDIWKGIIFDIKKHYSYDLIFLGEDTYPGPFETFLNENGYRTKDFKLSIWDEYLFLKEATAFIGMASGPSNMAILSSTPYYIFKHEEDAWEEKFDEINSEHKLKCSVQNQFYKIGIENLSDISSFLNGLKT